MSRKTVKGILSTFLKAQSHRGGVARSIALLALLLCTSCQCDEESQSVAEEAQAKDVVPAWKRGRRGPHVPLEDPLVDYGPRLIFSSVHEPFDSTQAMYSYSFLDGTLREVVPREILHSDGAEHFVSPVSLSPNGRYVAMYIRIGFGGPRRIIDRVTGQVTDLLCETPPDVMAWTSDSEYFYYHSGYHLMQWESKTGELKEVSYHGAGYWWLLSDDETWFLREYQRFEKRNLAGDILETIVPPGLGESRDYVLSGNGRYLMMFRHKTMEIWDLEFPDKVAFRSEMATVFGSAISHDGLTIFYLVYGPKFIKFKWKTGEKEEIKDLSRLSPSEGFTVYTPPGSENVPL